MSRNRLLAAACVAALATGCTKRPGPASPDFQKARQDYLDLLAKDGPADVYGDPALTSIRAQLDKVPGDSVDADAAHALASTIDKGVADAKAAKEAHEKMVAETARAVDVPMPAPSAPTPGAPQPAKPATPGSVAPSGPSSGMSAADFMLKYSSCFTKDSTFKDDQGHQGDAWALSSTCETKYPAFKDELVLVTSEKVLNVVPKSAAKTTQISMNKPGQTQQQPAQAAQPQAPAQQQPAAPPPPPNPNTIDQRVTGADSQVAVPQNLNSDLDAREKLPGQP